MNEMNVKPKRCTADKPMGGADNDSPLAMAAVLYFSLSDFIAAILHSIQQEESKGNKRKGNGHL